MTAASASAEQASALILSAGSVAIVFAVIQFCLVSRIRVPGQPRGGRSRGYRPLSVQSDPEEDGREDGRLGNGTLYDIYMAIRRGANAFLRAEYLICTVFIILFSVVVLVLTAHTRDGWEWTVGAFTATAFAVGAFTSILSGYIGMTVATFSNARTTMEACKRGSQGWTASFNAAFRAGNVMGFALCGLALLVLFLLIALFKMHYDYGEHRSMARTLFECVAGYGLGGSSIALFGRVGGGIYTKAADVGADLAGKVVEDIPEDDPRNPATIADNVGDNVGDVAGMGSDLFGSFAEGTCAALVVASSSSELVTAGWASLMFPLLIAALGILVCMGTSFFATHLFPVRKEAHVERALKVQLFVSAAAMTACLYPVTKAFLPEKFAIPTHEGVRGGAGCEHAGELKTVTAVGAYACVCSGLWAGCLIGFITEYFTSHSYKPVRELAQSCETGAATNIIYGLSLGYKSNILPISLIAGAVYISFSVADMYGVALAALGMLATLATCLSIDVYGPVCDNAGGIAEMAELDERVRNKTDCLDAAGNTTAAIGKGFAIGSAALVSLALFGGFQSRIGQSTECHKVVIDILRPITFSMLLMGAMLPYAFTAMTMKSVGVAAMRMVKEVKHQFDTKEGLLAGTPGHEKPDHARCIKIATDASLREMILPGLLVMLSPIVTGVLFGVEGVSGLLVGALVSGVQLAISQSNSGGAWDNAKKYVEKGCVAVKVRGAACHEVQGKGTALHKASVVGDTVGDPLKDTSGPALNILMKLMAIISLVFADFFMSINNGRGLLGVPTGVEWKPSF